MKANFFSVIIISIFLVIPTGNASSHYALPKDAQTTLNQVYDTYVNEKSGKKATYIPELAKVDPNLFGIAIVTVEGQSIAVGNVDVPFSLQSISKVFVYALALQDQGQKFMFEEVGLDATGQKFNSLTAIEQKEERLQNPFVNAGAIQTTSFIKGKNSDEKWSRVLNLFNGSSDGKIFLSNEVYHSEMATNQRNRAIVQLLKSYNMIDGDPLDALDRYTRACAVMVTAKQLALMGATLANNGVNPITKKSIITPAYIRDVLSQMVINGLYEKSGTWFVEVGIPTKSGVSGGLLAIIPNKMAIAVFSPPLDEAGNSVRGQEVIKALSARWKLHELDN